jgi:murein L,D-transpeptidase YcbB/YkuD
MSSVRAPDLAREAARFDTLLTAGLVRYLRHLHLGRINPRSLGMQLTLPVDDHDFATVLQKAIESGQVADTVESVRPSLAQYRLLRRALADYRAHAAITLRAPVVRAPVRPGEAIAEASSLHAFLVRLGDLPTDAPPPSAPILDPVLVEGVRRFQQRHGLTADGVIGRGTASALAVTMSTRVRQIELALERLRWLPDFTGGRLVAINIPMFRLYAWNSAPSVDPPALTMSVIVGRAIDTQTPVFAAHLEYVVFRPHWNVPRSILRGEILPAVQLDPAYLDKSNFEIVAGLDEDAQVLAMTADSFAALASGTARVRQRPGPDNALGLVKFMFPNVNDVYMHATPATELFGRDRRDFSHGCIRVEDPVGLAAWALGADAGWTPGRVRAAMDGTPNSRVDLRDPVPVVIFYTTAVVDPTDGTVHFANDIYGQDAVLDRALTAAR